MKKLMALVMGLIMLPVLAVAATIHVPADQPTIQAGINAAVDGDTVLVAPGTYAERLVVEDKGIVLTSSAGRKTTYLDCPDSILDIRNTQIDIVVSGFTFRNAINAAIIVRSCDSLRVSDCLFSTPADYAVRFYDSKIVIEGNYLFATGKVSGINSGLLALRNVFAFSDVQPTVEVFVGEINVINNTFYDCWSGVSYQSAVTGTVRNNIFQKIGYFAIHKDQCQVNLLWEFNDFYEVNTVFVGVCGQQGNGNIFENPLLIAPDAMNFSLRADSPCRDAGDPSPQYDDPDGTRNDIGAFYVINSPPTVPQLRLPLDEAIVSSQQPELVIRNSTDADFDTSQVQYPPVIPTGVWTDFVSLDVKIDADSVPVGTVVDAFDPQGVHCGHFITSQRGIMGPLHVFGDDGMTPVDEGCVMGDTVTFRINSVLATTSPPDSPTWRGLGPYKIIGLAAPARDSLLYTFEVSPDNFAATIFTFTKKQDADSLTTLIVDSTLVENAQYWWRVKASDYYESSEYSPVRSFFVNATNIAPTAVSLTQPANTIVTPLTILRPQFVWTPATDPDPLDSITYDLVIAIDSNFLFVQQIPNLTAISHALTSDLLWRMRYWWKVKSLDRQDAFNWSQVFTFRTMTLGDANGDRVVDISDVVYLVAYIFSGGLPPNPSLAGDANCDGTVDISDVVYLIAYIFSGGSVPCSEF